MAVFPLLRVFVGAALGIELLGEGGAFFGSAAGGTTFDVTCVEISLVEATVAMVLATVVGTVFCKVIGEVFRCVAGFIIILPGPKRRKNVNRNK